MLYASISGSALRFTVSFVVFLFILAAFATFSGRTSLASNRNVCALTAIGTILEDS